MLEMGTFCTIFHIAKMSLVWAAICTLNNATSAILDVFYKDLTVHVIGQTKAHRSACYNAGAIFDSISSEPWEWKDLVMAEKNQKPMSYFFKWRKQCESCSWRFGQWSNKKKLPPKLNENSSHDGLKLLVAGLWSRKQQNEAQFIWVRLANIRISCDNFSLLWKLHVQTYFFCAVLVILKSTPCLIGKERGKQNNYLHTSFWKHKLQTWKSIIIIEVTSTV